MTFQMQGTGSVAAAIENQNNEPAEQRGKCNQRDLKFKVEN
jgi:hypothetical protein